jgi:hypothetical protein
MADVFEGIDDALRAWLNKQHMFFVGTAPLDANVFVNCSPKGYDCFRILNEREVAYLDMTGSGIETVAHLQENGRIVFMFCSFDATPRIVRLHGKGFVYENGSPEFEKLLPLFEARTGMRSIIRAELTRISDSCGYGVPRYDYRGDRNTLVDYWENKGEQGAVDYQRTENAASLDGLPGIRVHETHS